MKESSLIFQLLYLCVGDFSEDSVSGGHNFSADEVQWVVDKPFVSMFWQFFEELYIMTALYNFDLILQLWSSI